MNPSTETFEEFYQTYRERVRWRVSRLLYRHPQLIDDVVQETWIKIWRALPHLTHDRNISSWVIMVATNAVRDAIRREQTSTYKCYSWEGYLEHAGIAADELDAPVFVSVDPHSYLPEQWERQEIRQQVWDATQKQDKAVFRDYLENRTVKKQHIYTARHNFKDKRQRYEHKRERMAS